MRRPFPSAPVDPGLCHWLRIARKRNHSAQSRGRGLTHTQHGLRSRNPQLLGIHRSCDRDQQIGSLYLFCLCFRFFRKL